MDIIKKDLIDNIYIPRTLREDLSNKNICFLDIETTGLSGKFNEVVLIGMLCVEENNTYITQFFANSVKEEYELLDSFVKFIDKFEYIITYNGNSFDIPFLKKRLEYHKIDFNLDKFDYLDLLKVVRKNKQLLKLTDCKLKTVERALNIFREDNISGKESVTLYKDYVHSKDPLKKQLILKHNYYDIYYLPKILSLYDIIEDKDNLNLTVNFNQMEVTLIISKGLLEFNKNLLKINAISDKLNLPKQIYYKDFYSLDWTPSIGVLKLDINYKSAILSSGERCDYIDLDELEVSIDDMCTENYNIPDNILLLKVDEKVIYKNVLKLIDNIICNLE